MEAPFITLRSHTSSGSSLTLHNPSNIDLPKPPQLDLTHYNFHTKDVAVLAQTMEVVANKTLPNRGPSRYKEVRVLLLRWEEDDLEVEWELNELSIIFQAYGFDTETYLIPSQSSHTKLNRKASDFVEQFEDENSLLIVYYGGHASINNARQLSWSCKRQPGSSSLNWSAIQSLFEHSQSDVLLLLDCCAAAAATPMPIDTGSSTEIIAACGWEQRAPEPGIHSFTNAIIDVLEDWLEKRPVFSTAQLFREVADVLKQPRPRRNMETSTTPVHLVTTLNPKAPSIELRRKVGKQAPDVTMVVGRSSTSISNTETKSLLGELSQKDEALCKSNFNLSEEDIARPHFIFAAALKEDQILETKQFIDWIKQFPATVQYTLVQGLHLRYPKLSALPMLTSERDIFSRNLASKLIEQAISDVSQETEKPVDSAPISPRYKEVHALLLRWEDDPMGISWEVDDLAKVFETAYGFRTEIWLIPNEASFFSVLSKAIKMVEDFGKEGNLMIVYYYGHGLINSFRHAIWYCKQEDEDGKRSSLDWSLIQAIFDEAKSDILVLLDCCAAASGAPIKCHSNRVTETIAACGFETFTTTPGQHSFTSALIDVLEDWTVRPYFSAAMLHCEIFSRLRHEKPEIRGLNKALDRHRTPIHILSTSDPEARSVELRPQHGIARTRSLGNGRLRLSSKPTFSSQLKGFSQPDYSSVKVEDEL